MRFGLLGDLRIVDDAGVERTVPAAKQRILLAGLLLDANRTVSRDALVDVLWDSTPPPNAGAALRTYLARLRHALGDAQSRIIAKPSGFLLELREPTELDVSEVEHYYGSAAAAARESRWERASQALRAAESLWRGTPLADVPSDVLRRNELPRLEELHLAVTEARVEAELNLGHARDLVGELRTLAEANPLREQVHRQLILTLYRCGRPAEALESYQALRSRLADQLGLDPTAETQDLHQAILTSDPALDRPTDERRRAEDDPVSVPSFPQRNDLPGDLPDFTGRASEIGALLSGSARRDSTASVVCVLDGMAGVGKTATAVHVAHRLAAEYPDAQLFLDLQAYAEDRSPIPAAEALTVLLRTVGLAAERIPESLEERSALWRTHLAGRSVLLLLDNASDAAQIRPLLPGAPGSLTLVTSRRRLADLDTAHSLSLEVLPTDDAQRLLEAVAGVRRIAAEPGSAAEVVQACGRLPLAIRIAAARLRSRPAWSVADLAARLGDDRRRLTELTVGDRGVERAFALSYQHLAEPLRRIFRLCGLLPGTDFDPYIVAALAALPLPDAENALEELLDLHLLQQAAPGRYRFHDLLRDHARSTAQREESPDAAREALSRAFDYYLYASENAADQLAPGRGQRRCEPARPPADFPVVRNYAEARLWCDTELANLTATVTYAAANGWDTVAWQIPHALWQYLNNRHYVEEWFRQHSTALEAARRSGDVWGQAEILKGLGSASLQYSLYQQALDYQHRALTLYREIGDQRGQTAALANLGSAYSQLNQFDKALECQLEALARYRELGLERSQANCLINLGLIYGRSDRPTEALERYNQALDLYRHLGDTRHEGACLMNLGDVYEQLGRYEEALDHLERALVVIRRAGDRRSEAGCVLNLGVVYTGLGRYEEAVDHLERAAAAMHEVANPDDESLALLQLAESCHVRGMFDQAVVQGQRALRLVLDSEDRLLLARVHSALARDHTLLGNQTHAEEHQRQADAIHAEFGSVERVTR